MLRELEVPININPLDRLGGKSCTCASDKQARRKAERVVLDHVLVHGQMDGCWVHRLQASRI